MNKIAKVIVIGLDGLEPKLVEPMLASGQLPHLARLREQGGYARVRTTFPAQTPVAWSTFATGTNPGGHGIYDFIARDPKTYLPVLALNRYEQKNAFTPPRVVNGRQGVPFWQLLSQAGIQSVVLRHPLTYPPDNIRGRMLGGVGIPDLLGSMGTYTLYTSAAGVEKQEGESLVHVQVDGNGHIGTHLIGPRPAANRPELTLPLDIQVEDDQGRIVIRSAGQPREITLRPGEWSDWLKVKFSAGPLVSVRGMVRFHLLRLSPEFELFASPINFDPEAPLFPITSPPEYARELTARLGSFYTVGMAEEDAGLKNRRLDESAFLAQCAEVLREREAMMLHELKRQRDGLFFILFDTPDRLQHLFWRFGEPGHPANRDDVTPELAAVIGQHYRALDDIVGRACEFADERTLVLVLSDHGMNSFQRGLNLNTWLYDNGFLALQPGVVPGPAAGDFLRCVDWSGTSAYALGLGGIYLNLKGREAGGTVSIERAEEVKGQIARRLTGLIDPERGQSAVNSVVTREQIYRGPYVGQAPDLLANFAPGYRASWGTPLGSVPAGWFVDNDKKWGGDHCIDPSLVPGILFMNRPFDSTAPGLEDLAPTILSALGVPKGQAMHGHNLITES